jgi:salicylate hydroxylase
VAAARTIIVAGAGIGGLTAALALAGRGFRIVILEKTERLEEAGAGLQLSPNAGSWSISAFSSDWRRAR